MLADHESLQRVEETMASHYEVDKLKPSAQMVLYCIQIMPEAGTFYDSLRLKVKRNLQTFEAQAQRNLKIFEALGPMQKQVLPEILKNRVENETSPQGERVRPWARALLAHANQRRSEKPLKYVDESINPAYLLKFKVGKGKKMKTPSEESKCLLLFRFYQRFFEQNGNGMKGYPCLGTFI
ncbi:hypothetical protein TNCV_2852911 [Trichonephila clavipes]|uniref:Uncharacterized protein n=1 Tax=Trichonephila clavipes TaxID=2585209 RepID=A0A8X6R5W9_TRICX|nr:hypothetical protein TNCV_2852911 [Trichonephila clavipes]